MLLMRVFIYLLFLFSFCFQSNVLAKNLERSDFRVKDYNEHKYGQKMEPLYTYDFFSNNVEYKKFNYQIKGKFCKGSNNIKEASHLTATDGYGEEEFTFEVFCRLTGSYKSYLEHFRDYADKEAERICNSNHMRHANYLGRTKNRIIENTISTVISLGTAINKQLIGVSYACTDLTVAGAAKATEDEVNRVYKLQSIQENKTDKKLCEFMTSETGYFLIPFYEGQIYAALELEERSLDEIKCRELTGRMTAGMKQEKIEAEKIISEKNKIANMKSDCADLGFTHGTDGMGNCVLKLMELESKNNNSANVYVTESGASNEIIDIEKQKLETQREQLKAEQERLAAEQERVKQERKKAQRIQSEKLMDLSKCYLSGNWVC